MDPSRTTRDRKVTNSAKKLVHQLIYLAEISKVPCRNGADVLFVLSVFEGFHLWTKTSPTAGEVTKF